MVQLQLPLLAAVMSVMALSAAAAPAADLPVVLHRREDGHVVSDSSSDESPEIHHRAPPESPSLDVFRSASHSEPEEDTLQQKADSVDEEEAADIDQEMRTSWERLYKHGVVPARLPALEKGNIHRYRHSIVHSYGDDIHA